MPEPTKTPPEAYSISAAIMNAFLRLAESLEANAAYALRRPVIIGAQDVSGEAEWASEVAKRALVAASELRGAARVLAAVARAREPLAMTEPSPEPAKPVG